MKIERLQPREPRWRQKFRDALEKEADNILAVVGLMSAIWAWREAMSFNRTAYWKDAWQERAGRVSELNARLAQLEL